MKPGNLLTVLIGILVLCAFCAAQDELAEGRKLASRLGAGDAADLATLQSVGFDRAEHLLMAVVNQGQSKEATTEDWLNLHRGLDGLIALNSSRRNFLQASVYASFQDAFYRKLEGDNRAALAAAKSALDLHIRSGVAENLERSFAAYGRALVAAGDPEQAVAQFRQARTRARNQRSAAAGQDWRAIVLAELAANHAVSAREEAERFVAAAPAVGPFRGSAHLAMSDVLLAEARYDDAVNELQRARGAGLDDWEVASQALSFVLMSMRTLRYDQAMALAKRMETEFPGLPVPIPAFARQAIEVRRRLAGDIAGVLRDQEGQLEAARTAHNAGAEIDARMGIAATYQAANSIASQVSSLEAALDLERSQLGSQRPPGSSSPLYRILNLLGEAYVRLREPVKARKAFNEVTRTVDALPDAKRQSEAAGVYGEAMLGKAEAAALDDDADTARSIFRSAIKGGLRRGSFARDDLLWRAARFEDSQGEARSAASYYEQAIEAIHAARKGPDEVACRIEYAHLLIVHAARIPGAAALANTQIETARKLAAHLNLGGSQWRVLYERGLLLERQRDRTAALKSYQEAIGKLESIRSALTSQEQRQSLLDAQAAQDLFRRAIGLLATGHDDGAWELLERSKARGFLDALQGRRLGGGNTSQPEFERVTDLERRIAELRFEMLPNNERVLRSSGREPAIARGELVNLKSQLALALQESALPENRAGQSVTTRAVPFTRLQKLLPPRTALIEYGLLNDGLLAYVATRRSMRQARWKVSPEALGRKIRRLRVLLADATSGEEWKPLSASVSDDVWKPLHPLLPEGIRGLIIVPAGLLYYLPFQVLVMESGRLVDSYAISYLPSASSLAYLPRKSARPKNLFLGALGDVSIEGQAPLPGTLREVAGIARLYPGAELATKLDFTHERARTALMRNAAVHFATHGLLDQQAPLFSALLTAGGSGEPPRLPLYELADLGIHARLVVLSACETGLGKLSGGDEISGLTRTLLISGANTVVSSLWKVSDDSTAMLMQGFYRRLRRGVSPARAMRDSTLEVRRQFTHPFYWAPFIVTGAR